MKAPETLNGQGKTSPTPQVDVPKMDADPWSDWLVQNAKGRVRVFNGLEAQDSKSGFLGALTPSSVGRVGACVRAPTGKVAPGHAQAVAKRSREIRELMSFCISQNLVVE